MLATLLLSAGVPMLRGGDELGATQRGNNNAYCQDNDASWLDWSAAPADPAGHDPHLRDMVAALIALRRSHPVLRQHDFFRGVDTPNGHKDVAWLRPDGVEMTEGDWFQPRCELLGMFLSGDGIRTRSARGERIVDDSFLLWLNASEHPQQVLLPGAPWAEEYTLVLDTAATDPIPASMVLAGTSRRHLRPWSVQLLRISHLKPG